MFKEFYFAHKNVKTRITKQNIFKIINITIWIRKFLFTKLYHKEL